MNTSEQEQKQQPTPALMAAFLFVIYVGVAVYSLLGWAGLQSLTSAWRKMSDGVLGLYGLVGLVGAISSIVILRWKRWGVYGMLGTWAATAILNIAFPRPMNIVSQIMALLVIAIAALDFRRVWCFLT